MNTTEIVNELRGAGAVIEAHGDRLRIDAPKGLLTPERREALRAHKHELLRWLSWHDEQAPGRRVVIEYQLREAGKAWLVLLGAPGESYESAADGLRRRYGDRLLDLRPYRAKGAA